MTEIALTQADSGRTIRAAVGDAIRIELPETPTTGFRWAVGPLDPALLALQGSEFSSPSGKAMGASGRRVFRFTVLGKGSAGLELKLARTWESVAPQAVFAVRLQTG